MNRIKFTPGLIASTLILAAVATIPLRADDTMMAETKAVDISHLHYLPANQPNATALLAPPPLPDSAEQSADLDEVRAVYHLATSNEIAAAYLEKKFTVFNYADAVGAYFLSNNLPKTTAFFQRVQKDAEAVTDNAKNFYKRPRPYFIDPSLANGKLEKSFSYPSGHSTESMVLALVLADLIPNKSDAIIAHARMIGWHRVEIARHYYTDICAGRVLAQAIVRKMKENPAFQKDFTEAKAEIIAAQAASKN
ncbi:MAG TPA: phosphatase PAP2 family protein [Verrucomicrobiae bacterium]|nr:phosphatase PAP2 family protein [Verrucomicrobiae bacterium]